MIKKLIVFILLFPALAFAGSNQVSSTAASTIIDRAEVYLNDADNRMWSAGELLTWLNDGQIDIATRSHCLEARETIFLDTDVIEYSIVSTYIAVKAVQYIDATHKAWSLKKGSPGSVGQVGEEQGESQVPTHWYTWSDEIGIYPSLASLANSASTIAISGAANNGADLVRITSATHGYSTNDTVTIAGIVGTTEANGDWTITVISTTTFDLVGSTFANTYTSGGTVFETETVSLYYITRPAALSASSSSITIPRVYETALVFYMCAQAWLKDLKPTKYLQMMALYDGELKRIRGDITEHPEIVE